MREKARKKMNFVVYNLAVTRAGALLYWSTERKENINWKKIHSLEYGKGALFAPGLKVFFILEPDPGPAHTIVDHWTSRWRYCSTS